MRCWLEGAALVVLLGWSGISCAGSKEIPLAAADRAQIGTAESVQVVRRSPVGLILQKSPDDMVWGDLATARQLERGGQWRQQYGVVDPVLRTAERLGAAFHDDFGAPLVLPVIEIGSDDPQAIAASVGRGLVLDVQTETWQVLCWSSATELLTAVVSDQYQLRYQASARLIEAPSGRVLWTARCDTATPDRASRPTFSALEANQAALLKKLQDEAADECARQLRAQLGAGT